MERVNVNILMIIGTFTVSLNIFFSVSLMASNHHDSFKYVLGDPHK